MAAQTWVILGASSALGRAFARRAARDGAQLLLAGRDSADLSDMAADLRTRFGAETATVTFDAVTQEGCDAIVARVAAAPLPGILLAFAVMPAQAELERQPARAAAVIGINLASAAATLLRLLPVLESKRGARVVVIGSVTGDRGRKRNYVYGASKAGLHALVSGYRGRLHRSGVSVTLVKAGPFDSAMTFARPELPGIATAEAVAHDCWRAAQQRRDLVYSPARWRWIMAAVRSIPEPIFKRLDL